MLSTKTFLSPYFLPVLNNVDFKYECSLDFIIHKIGILHAQKKDNNIMMAVKQLQKFLKLTYTMR